MSCKQSTPATDGINNEPRRPSRSSPPPGMVNGKQARRMLGLSQWIWDRWLSEGHIRCGKSVRPGDRYKWYPIEALRREVEALRAPQPFPPPGTVDGEQAREMFGVSMWMWNQWSKQRKIRCGRRVSLPQGGSAKVYPIEEMRRTIEALRDTGPFPPPGFVDRDGAAAMFGVSPFTWKSWVVAGKVRPGRLVPVPGGGQCYIYAVQELQRLREEMKGADKAYPDPQRPGHYHVPPNLVTRREGCRMFGVSLAVWKKWQRCGLMRGTRVGCALFYDVEEIRKLLPVYGPIAEPYPDPQRPGVYRVPLTSVGKLAGRPNRREAIIDVDDLPRVRGRRWAWTPPPNSGGLGHVAMSHAGETTPLRRFILGVTDPALHVSNRNGDPLDCRRANLVVRDTSDMMGAARKREATCGRPCTSRFKGVCWDERRGKWLAQIKKDGLHRHLGRFDDEIAAAQARDEAARELFGEHARLNFPDGVDAWLERAA